LGPSAWRCFGVARAAAAALVLSVAARCDEPRADQAAGSANDCGMLTRRLPMPKLERIILNVTGDVPDGAVAALVEAYRPKFAELGVRLEIGGEVCAETDLWLHYDLSGPGGGTMTTCRAGHRSVAKLNREAPSFDVVRIGFESIYWGTKCPVRPNI
jgi:hypothetical protein